MDSRVEQLIYLPDYDYDDLMRKVEETLGFKLFYWQWLFIKGGKGFHGRHTGETTALCLKALLADLNRAPIILPFRPESNIDELNRHQLLDIKEKLEAAGIETNEIQYIKRTINRR